MKDRNPSGIPLIAHIIYRLDVGGLENGLVNLINNIPAHRYRHAIVCLTEFTEFRKRIKRDDVDVFALNKREGKDLGVYFRLWRLLRSLRPDIVHTRNIGTLDCLVPALFAGVRRRVHGEHGREISDIHGRNRKYILLRKIHAPIVDRFVPMSKDLHQWLTGTVGVSERKITQLYNGVDLQKFIPQKAERVSLPAGFSAESIIIGSVGRMDPVKDQLTLVRAFLRLLEMVPRGRERLRLVHIGDGENHQKALDILAVGGAEHLAWLPGSQDNVQQILRNLDVFVLPSLAEGISNTILEAMATSLPVVATNVGGNSELVVDGSTGMLVEPGDAEAMAEAMAAYVTGPELASIHGASGRERVEREFSIDVMVKNYIELYDGLLAKVPSLLPGHVR